MPQRSIPFTGPLNLQASLATLGGKLPGQPRSTPVEGWWIGSGPAGAVTVQMHHRSGQIVCEAWGPSAGWALDRVGRLIGLDDDPGSFAPPRGPIRELHRRAKGLRLGRTGRVVDALVPTVLGQRVTTAAAERSFRRIVRRFGSPAPGPTEAWAPPDPAVLAGLSYEDLHPLGVERNRATILIEIARRAARLEAIMTMDRSDAHRRLQAVRGIGAWTSAIVMGVAWGDRDAVPVGDFHIPNMVAWALAGEDRADDARMLELLEPYAGHRRRVITLLKQAGIHAPKYGPKTAVRSFENQ